MSKLNKNDRLKRKAMRECQMYSPFYDAIFEAIAERERQRKEAQSKMSYRRERIVKPHRMFFL